MLGRLKFCRLVFIDLELDPKKLLLMDHVDDPVQLAFLHLSLNDTKEKDNSRVQIIKLFQIVLPIEDWPLDKLDTEGVTLKTRLDSFNFLKLGC